MVPQPRHGGHYSLTEPITDTFATGTKQICKKRRLGNHTNNSLSLSLQITPCFYSLSVFPAFFFTVCSSLHPGRERRNAASSHLHHPKEQGLAAVDPPGQKRSSTKQKKGRSRSSTGHGREKRTGRRCGVSEGGGRSDLQSPNSEVGEEASREVKGKGRSRRSRRRKRRTQSLPRDSLRNSDEIETEVEAVRGRKRESKRRPRKSRSVGSVRRRESEEEQDEDDGVERERERREEMEEKEWSEDDVFLPVPSPAQKLSRPKHGEEEEKKDWQVEKKDWQVEKKDWEVAAGYREMRREEVQVVSWENDRAESGETEAAEDGVKRPLAAVAIDAQSQRKPFSFLAATSVEQLQDDESDSGGSQSDVSMSAASISGLSLAASMQADGSRARTLPGPWLRPSQQKVAKVIEEGRPARGEGAAVALS